MTVIRAALYVAVASVLGVWLSSAASSMAQRDDSPPVVEETQEPGGLALQVQGESERLRRRLAAGPPAPRPLRNPFAFATERSSPAFDGRVPPPSFFGSEAAPPVPVPLSLIGVATRETPAGDVRTALMATADGALVMAAAGETVPGGLVVTAVAGDSVELTEPATGVVTRLWLGLEAVTGPEPQPRERP
jgi:hypothetical protein